MGLPNMMARFGYCLLAMVRPNDYTLVPHQSSPDRPGVCPRSDGGGSFDEPSSFDSAGDLEKKKEEPTRSWSRTAWVSPRLLSDATIGLADGLTVPFALTAGLSALGDARVVIYGGLAELIAGAISMGVGGYLGAKGECDAHSASLTSARRDIAERSRILDDQIHSTLSQYGLSATTLVTVTDELKSDPDALERFLMTFHYEQPDSAASSVRAYVSGLTIATGYLMGGILPLMPYLISRDMKTSFWWSSVVMIHVLFIFGAFKTWIIEDAHPGWASGYGSHG